MKNFQKLHCIIALISAFLLIPLDAEWQEDPLFGIIYTDPLLPEWIHIPLPAYMSPLPTTSSFNISFPYGFYGSWMYFQAAPAGEGYFIWTQNNDWIWTRDDVYPFAYSYNGGKWGRLDILQFLYDLSPGCSCETVMDAVAGEINGGHRSGSEILYISDLPFGKLYFDCTENGMLTGVTLAPIEGSSVSTNIQLYLLDKTSSPLTDTSERMALRQHWLDAGDYVLFPYFEGPSYRLLRYDPYIRHMVLQNKDKLSRRSYAYRTTNGYCVLFTDQAFEWKVGPFQYIPSSSEPIKWEPPPLTETSLSLSFSPDVLQPIEEPVIPDVPLLARVIVYEGKNGADTIRYRAADHWQDIGRRFFTPDAIASRTQQLISFLQGDTESLFEYDSGSILSASYIEDGLLTYTRDYAVSSWEYFYTYRIHRNSVKVWKLGYNRYISGEAWLAEKLGE